MIYEFALEPGLVATWHEPRAAYPILSHLGPGQPRVACAFPAAVWKNLVVAALRALFQEEQSPHWQAAKKNVEILLRHLHETGTTRNGRIGEGESWRTVVEREHALYPFGGIVVASSADRHDYLVVADQLGNEPFAAWDRPAPPVPRQARELAAALAPLLRYATCLRFVDPYFDAAEATFLDPMREFLSAAQRRRDVRSLQIEIHFGIGADEVAQVGRREQRIVTELECAQRRVDSCRTVLMPLLQPGVSLRLRAWGALIEKPHNRYVLAKVGGILLGTGLDRTNPRGRQTDDLTLLSKAQHEKRWRQFMRESTDLRLIAHWDGTAPG